MKFMFNFGGGAALRNFKFDKKWQLNSSSNALAAISSR